MRSRVNFYTVGSATFSIIALIFFWILSVLFEETLLLYLGVLFAFAIFFCLLTVLRPNVDQLVLKIARSQTRDIFLYVLTILSIVIILGVPAYEGSMLEWMKIPPLNWLRYLFALLLTNFLPGYFFLKILDRKHVMTGSIVIVLSYLLSLFITFLVGFFILLSGDLLETLGLQIMIAVNIVLIIIHYFANRKKTRNFLLTVDRTELGLILSVLFIVIIGSIMLMINNMPLTSGDMVRHYGSTLDLSNGFPVYGGKMSIYEGGYLFAIYLNVLFLLSGIPLAITEQGLYILSFITVLAFYSSIKVWFSEKFDKRLPLIATIFSILLGFGGLYALYLKFADPTFISITQLLNIATSKTYDIYMRILYLPDIVGPLWNIGLPVFFTLLYLLKKESHILTKAAIVSILVILGYLAHASEIFLFCFILLIYVLFVRRRSEAKMGPYVFLGLVIVAVLDFVAPAQVYVLFDAGTVISLPFVVSLILAALTSIAESVKDKGVFVFLTALRNSLIDKLGKSWRYGRWLLLYIYVFSIVFWLSMIADFNLWDWGGYNFTPFFVLPTRIGAVGLMALISIAIYFSKIIKNRTLLFFLLLIPIGFIFEQAANYYQLYYPAYRFGTITFVGACVIAAYGVIAGINKIKSPKRKVAAGILLGFLVISGMVSTSLFYVNASFYSVNSNISQNELDALDYIRQNTPGNASVFTLTTASANNLRNFAGLNGVQDAQRWSQLLSTSNPYIITYILSSSNIKYVYVTQRDVELLNKIQLKSFLEYFPEVFKNDYVTVYEVPRLTGSSPGASFGVLYFSPSLQSIDNALWTDGSFTEAWYPYRQYGQVKNSESFVEDGIMNLSVTSNQSGNIWASYSHPLALKTKNCVFSFRYKVDNDNTWFTIILQNSTSKSFFYKGHLTDKGFTTKSYNLPDGQDITRVELIVETTDKSPPQTTAIAQVDHIEILEKPFSEDDVLPSLFISMLNLGYSAYYVDNSLMENIDKYLSHHSNILLASDPPFPIENFLNWISAGKTLTVFNTHGNGFFANLLGIYNSSSLLSIKNINSGKVIYINSMIDVGKESAIIQAGFIDEFRKNIKAEGYSQRGETLPVYNSAFGDMQVNGYLNIETDVLSLQGAINLTGSPFSINEYTKIELYGKISLSIKNASLLVSPSESYLLINPEIYPIEGQVLIDVLDEAMIITDTNAIYTSGLPISFNFQATQLCLRANRPSVNASGTIVFDQLDAHSALYVPLAGIIQQKAKIQGSVKFDTLYISYPITMFSSFEAEGNVVNLSETTSTPTINIIEMLLSPYNLAFNAFFFICASVYVIIKRRKKATFKLKNIRI
jgi:hypothetical protein